MPLSLPTTLPMPGLPAGALSSKLSPPLSQARQVLRQAVVRRMAESGGVKLLLVRAPAGFGKTTAMVQARARLAADGVATAWLTLERTDNDAPRFLACLQQAVAQIVGPGRAAGSAAPGLGGPATPLAVVDALAHHGAPFALFLDDFELITEPAVLGVVREIIDHLPRRGQLVLGSRSLPDLGLGRLRMAGQLLEIDTELLRFSRDETRQFLELRWPGPGGSSSGTSTSGSGGTSATSGPSEPGMSGGPADMAAQIDPLHTKTEGWVAALWLASMALDSVLARQGSVATFIAQFSGSDRAVADFLAEDVLARQSPEVRDFLLRTSILRQFNAPLCQVLTPRSDAAAILAQLDAANLFITPIGDGRQGDPGGQASDSAREWRYHSLFADFLRAQLVREQPDALARLHLAASGWYESQGRPVPAIDHAIEGGDAPHAISLLAGHAMGFLEQGRMRLLARWFAALQNAAGAAALAERPMLQVVSLWASNLTRGPWVAMDQLQQSGCASSADAAVRAHVNALQPMLLAMMDRVEDAAALGREALTRVPTGQPFADSVLCNVMAHVMGVLGEREQAQRLLDAARRGQQGDGFNRMYTESVEGLLDLQQGRLRQATARFRLALGISAMPGAALSWQPAHGNAWAGVLYAGVVYEAHQPTQAEHLLNVYLPLARDVGLPDHMILSHVMCARLAFGRGDIDAALQYITELEHLGHHRQLPRVVASARLERARVLMLQGQAEAAAQALDRADDATVWQRVARQQSSAHDLDDMSIARLRWQVLFGDPAAAARAAAAAAAQAQAAQRQRRALKLQVLQALALQRAGSSADLDAALAIGMRLLQAAQVEGYVRLLLDEGPAVGTLLRRMQAALQASGERIDPLIDDCLQRLIALAGDEPMADEPAPPPDVAAPAAALDEPLTRKEIRVLQLLAEGYSNSVMAEKLFVSDSTVRTHLRNINLKVGARSRTQAVAIARRLGVIA